MAPSFQVLLSSAPAGPAWGDSNLSFNENGATIHVKSLVDDSSTLTQVQKAARKIAGLKVPSIELVGDWTLESQWHFWQGLSSPLEMPKLKFADMGSAEQERLESLVKIHTWVKQLINTPPQEIYPLSLANEVGEFISQLAPDKVSYQIISGEELADKGYVGIYNVGRGSKHPPALLTLDFTPNTSDMPPAAVLVGKGITFDSGGYSLKQSQGMLHMKSDMGGAATVAGALALAIESGLDKNVRLILCCAENLVSGDAYKLSDILNYRNGVSVEVVNTDAEGRLVLADGLIDAAESESSLIVDAATLTGAAVVAVGDDYNATFSMDDALAEKYQAICDSTFDPCWRLPLNMSHQNNCPSAYADTANSKPVPGGGAGGASNAAGFLSRFLNTPENGWLHVDLAACYCGTANAMWSAGATGRGTRSLAELLTSLG